MKEIAAFKIVKRRPWSSWTIAALTSTPDARPGAIIEYELPHLSTQPDTNV